MNCIPPKTVLATTQLENRGGPSNKGACEKATGRKEEEPEAYRIYCKPDYKLTYTNFQCKDIKSYKDSIVSCLMSLG